MIKDIISESLLRNEYEVTALSDLEISEKYYTSVRSICRLRKIYGIKTDPHYQYRRNSLRFFPLTEYQREFLHGSLFGDSCISAQKSGTGYWCCRHGIDQEPYLLKKARIMEPFVSNIKHGMRAFKKGGKLFPYVDATSFALPQFTEYRSLFYPRGEKVLSAELFKKITPRGFVFWFFDDGSSTGYGFDITTFDSFFRQIENGINLFDSVLNLKVSIHWSSDGEGKIHVLKESHRTAWNYIEPEMQDCFQHKIPFQFRK
jgi:hypothetical protein